MVKKDMQSMSFRTCLECNKLHTRESHFCSKECAEKNLEKYFVSGAEN